MVRGHVAFTKRRRSAWALHVRLVPPLVTDFAMARVCAQSRSPMWNVSPTPAMAALLSVDRFARKMLTVHQGYLTLADVSSGVTIRVANVLTNLFLARSA